MPVIEHRPGNGHIYPSLRTKRSRALSCIFRSRLLKVASLFTVIALCSVGSFADDEPRKAKSMVKPAFPELARKMNLTGTVKLQVHISAAGVVTATEPIGGAPLFLKAAVDAVKKWRFETAPTATSQVVVFNFEKNESQ